MVEKGHKQLIWKKRNVPSTARKDILHNNSLNCLMFNDVVADGSCPDPDNNK